MTQTTAPVMLHCPVHGDYPRKEVSALGLTIRQDRCSQCLRAELDAEQAVSNAKESAIRQARLEKRIGQAGVPDGFKSRTLATFRAETAEQQTALDAATKYADGFKQHRNSGYSLIFLGGIGTGKTHLGVGITSAVLAQGYSAMYETASDIVTRMRDCMRRDAPVSTSAMLDTYGSIDLLIMDEIGIQGATDDVLTHLTNVIDRRYRNARPTIFISNLDRVSFPAYLGERIADRLRERASAITFNWQSQRAKARANAGF